jgi:hypothetical protein
MIEGGCSMKSLEEFYKEVQNSEDLKKQFVSAVKEGKTEEFLKANDCEATAADVMAFLHSVKEEAATEDDLAMVAGGCDFSDDCTDNCSEFATCAVNNFGVCP